MSWSFAKFEALPADKFLVWEKLLEARTGIQLVTNQSLVANASVHLRARAKYCNLHYQLVSKNNKAGLIEGKLVDRLVVKETTFFSSSTLNFMQQYVVNSLQQQALKLLIYGVLVVLLVKSPIVLPL